MIGRWHRTRLKYLVEANTAVLPESTDDDMEFVYVDIGNVTQGSVNTNAAPIRFADAPSRARRIAKPGDSVVSTVRTYLRAVATVPSHEEELIFSTAFAVLSPREEVRPEFLAWYLQGDEFVSRVEAHSTGVSYPAITATQLIALDLRLPSLEEQRVIADYLDRETARIDSLIEEQQRLIDLLRERRQAVVLHAIAEQNTKAAAVDKLGRSARIGNGSTPRRETAEYWSASGFPWLNSSVVNEPRVARADQFVTAEALRECHLPVVAPGSVLVGLTGQGKTRGMATILDIEATVNQHVAYVTPDAMKWLPDYLLWSLRASYGELRRLSEENGSTKGGLTCAALNQFRLAAPTLDDQRRIAAYLDEQTARIDTLIAETERFIELSRERRAALITAAVTGQIDVREAA
ncbi:hypothetical protein FXB39_10170 [Nocardioides sp. BGMRC 2183]|nr:hypothetical protein FXB39_10170 [Nocardioides sp. BGMRC 2183]